MIQSLLDWNDGMIIALLLQNPSAFKKRLKAISKGGERNNGWNQLLGTSKVRQGKRMPCIP
jgi:hypothetical protein